MSVPGPRRIRSVLSSAALVIASLQVAQAGDQVQGDETRFETPAGTIERCVKIAPVPQGTYSKSDRKTESDYCSIDFYAPAVALCPKTWSTSPGMMIYDVASGPYASDRAAFERNACKEGKSARNLAGDTLAKYKVTMNQSGTSGTFSPSPLLYYHFSRYFGTEVLVPVAVWRTMDSTLHAAEVARPGLAISGHNRSARMNHEGWRYLVAADEKPQSYTPVDDLFTADRTQIYGVLLNSPGHRYGSEINGTRKSGWGKGQNNDFQKTPAFLALRSPAPLPQAIADGLSEGRKDPQISKDLGPDVTPAQMAFWMREISEIVLLDFIFSQQDRVGNIDFTPYYYWVEGDDLKHKKAKHHEPGDGSVPQAAILLRRTNLNDNDAGGRVQYANFAKSTKMLEKFRHFDAGVYRRLMALNTDLAAQGPVYQWTENSFGLTDRQVQQVVKNTQLATDILRATCDRGELIFDLDPRMFLAKGSVTPQEVSCDGN
ncbi:hypothetical protein [Roseobacter ponti]|uniref:Uncharacterized protein n=1 Tax=Roseobacter ponti TaxID=1891787 RepID=A0A858SR56_9RHOB|nr:hypothetical protein [Roseobacter ponti]QJF50322.1 hypothetical protein G3256_03650 [Roseobacter ponti]